MSKPVICIAEHAGACYGVERALKLATQAANKAPKPVHTLGPLIHNPLVVADLEAAGVYEADTPSEAQEGTLIIRAHGVTPDVMSAACDAGLNVVDATCPYVKRVHHAAERLSQQGLQVVVVGEQGHPEVVGIVGHAGENAVIVSSEEDLDNVELKKRVGVVVQTTQTLERLRQIVDVLLTRVDELTIVNTICEATSERQSAARELAHKADVMVVVGGKSSGNTRRLAQICLESCLHTYHIESADEIDPTWFNGAQVIGITAGASTPEAHISAVVERIEQVIEHDEQ